jgi:Transglycosylase SLT domain
MRLASKFGIWISALLALATALPCLAGEVAVLKNGFSIRHERREVIGETTRLYVTADGSSFVDVPTAEIEHFEAAPDLPAPDPRPAGSGAGAKPPLLAKYARNGAPGASVFSQGASVDLNEVVNSASQRYWLDPDLVKSVIKAESGFNARAVSPKGAQGLMQLMPGTASQLGVPNAFDPAANVEGGTKYLRELLERYNFDLVKALAAYNAGPLRVEQFGGVPPYYETRAYVARVVRDFNKKKAAEEKAARQTAPSKKPTTKAATRKSQSSGTLTQAKANAGQEQN